MLLYFYLVVAAVCAPCIYFLLMTPMEKDEFFLTRWLADRLFPRTDRFVRDKRMQMLAGLIVACLGSAALIAVLINRFGRG